MAIENFKSECNDKSLHLNFEQDSMGNIYNRIAKKIAKQRIYPSEYH